MKSGVKKSKEHLLEAMEVFSKNGYLITTYITQKTGDATEFLKKDKTKYEIICVFGGDGTLNEVTNGLMQREDKPAIGYFPSGTMNDFGSNFNLNISFKEIAENICKNEYQEFDVGNCNGKYFNYVAAFGALCDVPYTTNRQAKEKLGTLAYILEGVTKLNEIKPIKIKSTIKGKTKTMNVLFGLIFSGGRVAGQQLIAKNKSKIDDGKFNIILVECAEDNKNNPDYLSILTQQSKYIHRLEASEVTLEFEEKVHWTLDGEKAELNNIVNIKNIQKALKIKS